MKSNLAILSSDKKSINFINNLNLKSKCNLYANCSRNVDIAERFSKENGFEKYYGSYEELIQDRSIDIVLNFLPSAIKFEYSYLCLKNGLRVICDYPIIKSSNEFSSYQEIIDNNLIHNLFLINDCNIKGFFENFENKKRLFYLKKINNISNEVNSLENNDILYELAPDLFFFLNKFKTSQFKLKILDIMRDKITNNINYFNCLIDIDSSIKLHILIDNSDPVDTSYNFKIDNSNEINDFIYNKEDLINFVVGKKPFDNLSEFQYYPFKLFQEVLLNE